MMLRRLILAAVIPAVTAPACAHDIYTRLKGKDGLLCCGGSDCAATTYRERGDTYEFKTREGAWVAIPQERIQFVPIPGDRIDDPETHRAHLCYRLKGAYDLPGDVFGSIRLFCAFIVPGGVVYNLRDRPLLWPHGIPERFETHIHSPH